MLVFAMLFMAIYSFPIAVINSNLGKKDLFLTQQALLDRINEQEVKQITIFNIQTSYADGEQFQSKLIKKMENLREMSLLMKNKQTYVSSQVDYTGFKVIQTLSENENLKVTTIPINFQNIKHIEQHLVKRSNEEIIVILFSKISSNVKLLEEITQQTLNQEMIAAQVETDVEADDEADSGNEVYNVTSNELTGYLIFFMLFYALWVSLQCTDQIIAPEKYTKLNLFVGKEN